jgi:hypothetical protein
MWHSYPPHHPTAMYERIAAAAYVYEAVVSTNFTFRTREQFPTHRELLPTPITSSIMTLTRISRVCVELNEAVYAPENVDG